MGIVSGIATPHRAGANGRVRNLVFLRSEALMSGTRGGDYELPRAQLHLRKIMSMRALIPTRQVMTMHSARNGRRLAQLGEHHVRRHGGSLSSNLRAVHQNPSPKTPPVTNPLLIFSTGRGYRRRRRSLADRSPKIRARVNHEVRSATSAFCRFAI